MNNHSYLFLNAKKLFANNPTGTFCWKFFNKFSSKGILKTHYETLNVSRESTTKDIKEAFITLSKKYHPDKNKGNAAAERQFVKINEAYSVLVKPESRKDYDSSLDYYGEHVQKSPPSAKSESYYGSHRRRQYEEEYYDPRQDPRKFHENFKNDDYYGIKGVRKQKNETVLKWIFIFLSAGIVIQATVLRFWQISHFSSDGRVKEMKAQYYERVKARENTNQTSQETKESLEKRLHYKQEQDNKLSLDS